jgi:hypothetical protein
MSVNPSKEYALQKKLARNIDKLSSDAVIVKGRDSYCWLKITEGSQKALVKFCECVIPGDVPAEILGSHYGNYPLASIAICVAADGDMGFVSNIVRRVADLNSEIKIYTVAATENPLLVSDPIGIFTVDATFSRLIVANVDAGVGV